MYANLTSKIGRVLKCGALGREASPVLIQDGLGVEIGPAALRPLEGSRPDRALQDELRAVRRHRRHELLVVAELDVVVVHDGSDLGVEVRDPGVGGVDPRPRQLGAERPAQEGGVADVHPDNVVDLGDREGLISQVFIRKL